MSGKVSLVGSGILALSLMGGAWATGSQWGNSSSGYVPDPQDVAFYYPLPDITPITSNFGWRTHPIYGDQRFHAGLDLGAPEGMSVLAAHSGWVRHAGWLDGYGNAVILEYADGQYQTLYAHLSEVLVTAGMAVHPRQLIGKVGSTGGVTGPHLHFELLKRADDDWVAVDPLKPIMTVENTATLPVVPIAPKTNGWASVQASVMPPMSAPIAPSPDGMALDFNPPR